MKTLIASIVILICMFGYIGINKNQPIDAPIIEADIEPTISIDSQEIMKGYDREPNEYNTFRITKRELKPIGNNELSSVAKASMEVEFYEARVKRLNDKIRADNMALLFK